MRCSKLFLASVLSLPCTLASLTAQEDPNAKAAPVAPLPGARPGTERWLAHFKTRPFDLGEFRKEMFGAKRPDVVARIVADIEKKMKAHQAAFVKKIEALDGRLTSQFWIVNGCAFEIAPKHLEEVRKFANVDHLEPDRAASLASSLEFSPNSSLAWIKTSTNSANHDSDSLQAKAITGKGVAIAILDTGHDSKVGTKTRPHLLYSNRGSTVSTRLLFNKKMGAQPADDVHGHGTAVASVAAGWKWNSKTNSDRGHAFDAKIAGYALAEHADGRSSSLAMVKGWQQTVQDSAANSIVVANMSYHDNPNPLSLSQKALDSAAYNADLLICTAAGNNGTSTAASSITVNGLSVASVTNGTHLLASTSSRGTTDGQVFPDISASGVGIIMAKRNDESGDVTWNGTSFASPQVAGIATLIRGANRKLKADETKAILLASAVRISGSGLIQKNGPGVGYLKADIAHEIAVSPARHGRATLTTNASTWSRCVPVIKDKTYQFAIAWHRKDMNSRLWSELSLSVSKPGVLLATSKNSRNTEQFLGFTAAITGTFTFTVSLFGANSKVPQVFAWACSSDTSPAGPDLIISAHSINATTLKAGLRYQIKATVKNVGTVLALSSRTGFYLSTDPIITTADRLLGSMFYKGIAAQASVSSWLTFTMPTGLSGTYYIGAIADYTNNQVECDETNNTSPGIKVQASAGDPDLQAAIFVPKGTLVAGTTATINASTDNRGVGTAGPSMMTISIGGWIVKKIQVPSIASKKFFGGKYTARVPNCAFSTTSTLVRVDVDVLSQVKESNEINNFRTATAISQPWDKNTGTPSLEYAPRLVPDINVKTATLSTKTGGQAQMCLLTPRSMNKQFYILFWSLSKTPAVDATTNFSLSLLNSPIFPRWFGLTPVSLSPLLVIPKTPLKRQFSVYTHGIIFPNTLLTEPLLTTIKP